MSSKYNIIYASPEAVPFAKTGGLADVAGALPKAIARAEHTVKVVMPFYASIDPQKYEITTLTKKLILKLHDREIKFGVKSCLDKATGTEFLFIDYPEFFMRDALYIDPATSKDYKDNDERFIMFSRAILETARFMDFQPDILHCNDWQSAPAIAFLKTQFNDDSFFEGTKSVYSIHNLAYQGNFPPETIIKMGYDTTWLYPMSPFEYWGKVSFMKAGIHYADVINTVSEQYAKEIQKTSEYGYGMEGILRDKADSLFGIVNGIDYEIWNPMTDELIPYHFSKDDLSGKAKNKAELLKSTGLPDDKIGLPLIGIISRLADQKGFDLISEISEIMLNMDLTVVLLGTGEPKYHTLFEKLQKNFPANFSANLKFDNKLAHLIEAGSDMFLMPSRYEPCGLNQLYSLKYGTIPIVRKTGGLADTIDDYNEKSGEGTGFVFEKYDAEELLKAIKRALQVYRNKDAWKKLMISAMKKDYSWNKSARRYIELYSYVLSN
ncbi:MAG: glycogen synthase GlgA [candidate division Zixibacteria bacterium]|nr:glycogen synthase GlgA [candidate division Zixibacteria bacterium]